MTAERLKVRCYRCNQLLGVPPNKAGAVVACPKCKAELLIPTPESAPEWDGASSTQMTPGRTPPPQVPAPAAPSSATELPRFLEEVTAAIPPEVADLRPEDLRVEAEFFESLTRQPSAAASPEPLPSALSGAATPPSPPIPDESGRLRFAPGPESGSWPPAAVDPVPVETPPPVPAAPALEDLPPIEIEPPRILPPGVEVRRVREVVLPASVVLAWSLFVLAGIAMSFLAGLLIGHFLWKNLP